MTAEASQPTNPPSDEISLWEVLAILIRRRAWIVGAMGVTAVLAIAVALLRSPTFTSEASFRPQGSGGGSELVALAAQFGVNVGGGGEDGESPAFYTELIASREILGRVATQTYSAGGTSGTLMELLEIEGDTEALELASAVEWLRDEVISVSTGRETGIVTLQVKTGWPELSQEIAANLLDEVSRFNLETRQSQAGAERAFIEERVDAAEAELREAERELTEFLQNNRIVGEYSLLMSERERLQREVLTRQQVYTTLVQSYEQARISEVRDTPVITVLGEPFLPPKSDGRGLVLALALGLVLGGLIGTVLAFASEILLRPSDGSDPGREDFDRAWSSLRRSLPFGGSSA